ncbi:MAG: hypothetical protein RLY35_909 [Bacteroidota bacterium]|jgi:hypothetical protein
MHLKHLYQKKVKTNWLFFKQLRELLFGLRHNNFRRQNGTVWISPQFPSRKSTLYQISRHLKFNLITEPFQNTQIGIHFHDTTLHDPIQNTKNIKIINKNISDISKQKVDQVHLEVFKYNTFIDPTNHLGKCVEKSDENALHDGIEIQCPIKQKNPDKVYQLVIDNQEGDLFVDHRVCVMKSDIVIIYKKYKTLEYRFTNDTCHATIEELNLIPEHVQKNILHFCKVMQCEFCELDVLKDNNSGKWFVIDLNKTPYGPPASLSKKDKKKAVEILSNGFAKNFLN